MTTVTSPRLLALKGAFAVVDVAAAGLAALGLAARVLAAGGVGHLSDLSLRKFAHLNSRLRRPQNVSHLINAAGWPALDQVAHLWIAN
jgi:hypothetical protein